MTPDDIARRVAGLIFFLIGVVGSGVLLVATATPSGVIGFGTFYAPPSFVVLVISLFLILFIEVGGSGLAGSRAWQVEGPPERRPWLSLAALVLLFGLPVLGLSAAGALWTVGQLGSGTLSPKSETYVVGAVLLIYAAIRIPIAVGLLNGGELARAVGIRPAGPDYGEPLARYFARTILGMAIGVLVLDALIVLANAILAPGDTTFYPGVTPLTPLAALLWIIGLIGLGWIATETIRTRTVIRSLRATIAAGALIPALVLGPSVPLYPMVMGAMRSVTVNDVAVRSAAQQSPFAGRAANPTPPAGPTVAPDAKVSGLVRWGEQPVPSVNVAIVNNGRASFALTDANGRYEAPVYAGTLYASVDVRAISFATWFTAARPGVVEVVSGRDATYPTIQLTRRVALSAPATGASVPLPITFRWVPQWQSLDAAVTYELRVFDDRAAAAPTAAQSTEVLVRRTTSTSLAVATLSAGRYRWSVNAYITPRAGGEMLIAQATLSSFTTR